ncbi:MAG: cell division protein ZipA, partial [Methylophaga sp.]
MLEIIILIFVVLLAIAVVGFISYQRNQKLANDFERELDHDDAASSDFHARYDAVFARDDDVEYDDNPVTLDGEKPGTEIKPDIAPDVAEPVAPEPAEPTPPEPDWDLVIALTVMAPKDRLFTGRAVKNALDNQDLHFGEMQIYHRFTLGSRKQSLFSAANIVDPGTFLPAELISMKTPGILLFARLPGPVNGLAVLDAMLDCATQMAEQLDGVVCNEQRQPLTDQALESVRARIFELNLNLQKDARP